MYVIKNMYICSEIPFTEFHVRHGLTHVVKCKSDTLLPPWAVCFPSEKTCIYNPLETQKMKQKLSQRIGWALCALLCALPAVTHGQAPCAVTVTSDFEAQYMGGSVVELVLMDMTGRTVATFVETEVADISRLSTGAYIVRIRIAAGDSEQVFYKKIVKK